MTEHEKIKQAFELSEDPQKISDYYKQWADKYDIDVLDENYAAPLLIAQLAHQFCSHERGISPESASILDAGCGTGLVGTALASLGFRSIVGFDLSPEMIEKAHQTNCYQALHGNVDMNNQLNTQIGAAEFDVVVCSGVFTLGHVPPPSLINLINITKEHGLIVLSAREEYCQQYDFVDYLKTLQDQTKITVLKQFFAEYVSSDKALYACIRVLPSDQQEQD